MKRRRKQQHIEQAKIATQAVETVKFAPTPDSTKQPIPPHGSAVLSGVAPILGSAQLSGAPVVLG